MVLGSASSHPAGIYKPQWRPDEYYNRIGDTIYDHNWLEKDIATYRTMRTPVMTLMPTMRQKLEPLRQMEAMRPRPLAKDLEMTRSSPCLGLNGGSPTNSPVAQTSPHRPSSVSGSRRSSNSSPTAVPNQREGREASNWCLPPPTPPYATSPSRSDEKHKPMNHLPLKENTVWPTTVPPQRKAVQAWA
mmetsp:Transcript_114813/g.245103  ORF Transcript_114813/g.245103 Transcript_114813/m.245103 type:complete len:188 (+) Transcript_114813:68-631(+)